MSARILEFALDHVRCYDWRLLPLVPRSKKPYIKNWVEAATNDLGQLKAWAAEWPSAGLGVLLGQATRTVVIDVDGQEGAALIKGMGLPETLTATTGKGKHYFFRSPNFPIKKKIRIFPEIDLLGDGCFVIVHPSIHLNGQQYRFDNYGQALAPLPQAIVDMVKQEPEPKVQIDPAAPIPKDTRHDTLRNLGRDIYKAGASIGAVRAALIHENETRCTPGPKPESEIDGILKWISDNVKPPVVNPNSGPLSINLSEVEPKKVDWLWPNFFPIGCASLISGNPGDAKTWLALDTVARLSKGTRWIDGTPVGKPANTLFLSVEDDAANTIRPRFDSLGGDPTRVAVYNAEQALQLNLSEAPGLMRLEYEINKIGNVRLVVIDPIIDFAGDTNPNAGEEVRALLTPLIQLAAKLQFALVLVGHLNKSQAMSAIFRAGGSTSGWLGKCRAAFIVFRDIDDPQRRHVVALKANLAPKEPPQLEFTIEAGQLIGRVSSEQVNVDEHLNPKPGRKPREKVAVLDWLENLFAGRDEIPATEIEAAAEKCGFKGITLKRAKAAGGYISKRVKFPGGLWGWVWQKITLSTVEK